MPQLNVKRSSFKWFFSSLAVLAILGSTYGGFLYFNTNLSTDNSSNQAQAATSPIGTGNVTVDKKYVTAGVESDTATVVQGGTTTVRLRYTNSNATSITDANIKDTLPANFTYVPGTFKNCLNPTATELVCDTLSVVNKNTAFATLINATGVSAAAGLYDGADTTAGVGTAVTSTSGLLGFGKKRYQFLQSDVCNGANQWSAAWPAPAYSDFFASNDPNFKTCPTGPVPGAVTKLDTLNKRYQFLQSNVCNGANQWSAAWPAPAYYDFFASNNPNFKTCPTGPAPGAVTKLDTLNQRYQFLQSDVCNGANQWSAAWPAPAYSDFFASNDPNFKTCPSGPAPGAVTKLDLLDTTRSSGYIEYQIQSANNIPIGVYGTNTTLSGTGFTALTDGGNTGGNGITITAAPAPEISSNKLYSTDGINWSSTVTALTGQEVFVRLLRDNSGTASASDVNQKDTIPTPFTYVPGSFKNCLSPSIVNITDNVPDVSQLVCDTLTATNKDTALTKLTSNTGISPIAGLYDAADTASNGTAISSATGLIEFGKKRYVTFESLGYSNAQIRQLSEGCGVYYSPTVGATSNVALSQSVGACGGVNSIEITGKKFLTFESLGYSNGNIRQLSEGCAVYYSPTLGGTSNVSLNQSLGACGGVNSIPILNKRYVVFESLAYTNSSNPAGCAVYYSPTLGGSSDAPINQSIGGCGGVASYNLVDSTNGQAFIEYKITSAANAAIGNYGTTSTLSSANASNTFSQTSGTAGTGITLIYPDFTTTDIPGLTLVCNNGASVNVNSTTSCTFTLPANKALPIDFKLGIGDATPGGICTVGAANLVTCDDVPTGSQPGARPINGQIGSGTVTPTGETVNVIRINFAKADWIFNPDQGGTSPLFRSSDNTSITVNNFRTPVDLTPTSNTRYTCTFEYRAYSDRLDTTATWRALNTTPIAYTTGSGATAGCTVNLTKQQRANPLNHSLRLTVTDTQSIDFPICNPGDTCVLGGPNTTYLFYNEYIYRFQGAGTASGG